MNASWHDPAMPVVLIVVAALILCAWIGAIAFLFSIPGVAQ